MARIVVGVDGSEGSQRALAWAVDEARLRGASLEVIYTYETYERHLAWQGDGEYGTMSAGATEAMREAMESAALEAAVRAQGLVDRMVDGLSGLEVEGRIIESSRPAETLVEHSKDADLLVVGSRGRGGFKSLMLGSVSQQCAQHAECPVVIIRSTSEQQA